MYELIIKNGHIVSPSEGVFDLNLAIKDGKIAALFSGNEYLEAKEVIDATGKFIFPGVIDPHTHFGIYNSWTEDFRQESRFASIGGVTTILNFYRTAASYHEVVPELLDTASEDTCVDFALHLGILTRLHMNELESYIDKYGITSFKFYTNYKSRIPELFGAEDGLHLNDGDLLDLLTETRKISKKIVMCVHCENMEISRSLEEKLNTPEANTLSYLDEISPGFSESDSLLSTLYLAHIADTKVYIVHLSSANSALLYESLPPWLQQVGWLETCMHYLVLDTNSSAGLKAKIAPPIRDSESAEKLWNYLAQGLIDTIGSDNCSILAEKKAIDKTALQAKPGFNGVGFSLPLLLSEGHHKRGIPIARIAEMTSLNPARVFGLDNCKGRIKPGYDADLVIVDLEKEQIINDGLNLGTSDFTVYEGINVKGWPVATLLRGRVIAKDGQIVTDKGWGRFLRREICV